MNTITIEVPAELHATLAACIAERDRGIAQAEAADRSGWNKALIDQGIDALALTGVRFSANDLRILLPDDLPGPLFGARFRHARENRGRIVIVDEVASSKLNTHGKKVYVYIGSEHQPEAEDGAA